MLARPKWLRPELFGSAQPAMARLHGRWRQAPRPARWGIIGGLILTLVLILFLLIFDWNWLRGPVGAYASARVHRQVTIVGDLKVHPWSFTPTAQAFDVRVAEPDWARAASLKEGRRGDMARIGALTVSVKFWDLVRGRTVLPLLAVERPDVRLRREKSGRANWTFSEATQKKGLKLPAIQHFIIDEGRLSIDDDQRGVTFVGTVSSNERAAGAQRGVFQLIGTGRLNGEAFKAEVTGAPLLNVSPDRPYPFKAQVVSGPSTIVADGAINKPFNLGLFHTDLRLTGPSLNKLYALTGVALPSTPPYRLHGLLARDGSQWKITGLSGRVGDSDLSGALSVDASGKRPRLTGDLVSRHLEWDDLMTVFGGPPSTRPGQTYNAEQKAQAQQMAAQGRLLPDTRLNTAKLRTLDADVRYKALRVTDPHVPVKAMDVSIALENGVLTAKPLILDLPVGRVTGRLRLDASGKTPEADADLTLSRGRIQDFVTAQRDGQPVIEGLLGGRIRLHGVGDSVHAAAASSSGFASVYAPSGRMRQAFAELLGINASKALLQLWSKDQHETPLRCAVATFKVGGGVMRADRLVIDTGVVTASGGGAVNLGEERMAFRLEGHSKKFRLVRVKAPILISGPLRHPSIGIETSAAAAQGGLGLLLGSVVSPAAAVLPFVSLGGAKDADCASLLAAAE